MEINITPTIEASSSNFWIIWEKDYAVYWSAQCPVCEFCTNFNIDPATSYRRFQEHLDSSHHSSRILWK